MKKPGGEMRRLPVDRSLIALYNTREIKSGAQVNSGFYDGAFIHIATMNDLFG